MVKGVKWMVLILALCYSEGLMAQRKGLESITDHDLRTHMLFLSSDELGGRASGEQGLQVAARYLAVQAQDLGLKEARPGSGYLQPFRIMELSQDHEKSAATILRKGEDPLVSSEPFYLMAGGGGTRTEVEGEVVFAGYGIHDEQQQYTDLAGLDIRDKIVLIMSRGPMNEDGTELLLEGYESAGNRGMGIIDFSRKLPYLFSQKPKAVLQVMDPKSGQFSLEGMSQRYASYLSRSRLLLGMDEEFSGTDDRPKLFIIHRDLADRLLESSGKTLEDLQRAIDRDLSPRSFPLEGVRVKLELNTRSSELRISNIFGLLEGSDPVLKDEIVLFLAHYDHMGTDDTGEVYNGADDNASGTVALLEIAEAFLQEKKKPKRSIGFLWVSAEEIGLFGSQFFAEHPMVPMDRIATVINIDMIGRTKTEADINSDRAGLTITGIDTVKVIGGLQSSVLMAINESTLKEMGMTGNYDYNNVNHPERYFFRSDHINFARNDIPVLFYSTGTHDDYHRTTDEEQRIDYDKFLKMTRLCYKVGFNVARYNGPIDVDHPMSAW